MIKVASFNAKGLTLPIHEVSWEYPENVNFTNLYNCTDGENTDKYQLNDPSQLIMLCDSVLIHNKIEISLTLRPDIDYWGETQYHQCTMISVGH